MYINDVHIAYYIVAAIFGLFVGELVNWANKRLPEYKKVFSKDFFIEKRFEFKPNYILMILTAVIYVGLIYVFGIKETLIANLDLIKYMILAPMLLSVFVIDYKLQIIPNRFVIDYKLQIIPNRLNLSLFEIGIIFAFLYGLSDVAISINMLLGMLAGGGIFLLITLVGGIFYGKEAMGFGDVKLMGALRTIFWTIKYNCYYIIIFPNRSNFKYNIITNKNKKIKRIYTIWTFYSNRNIYQYIYSI